jgi:hypothetical protein
MSKFKALFEEAKQEQSPTPKIARQKRQSQKVDMPPPAARTIGRRSDPNYTGAFAYIPAQLHEDVRRRLFGRKDLDFSGLVEQLLSEWIKKQK